MKSDVRTTTQLAAALGLSRWTISRALAGLPGVSAATARRVREEATRTGFSPSFLGRGLRSGKTDLIGIVAPDLEDYHLTRKIGVLRARIEEAGWHGVIQITDLTPESERAALARMASMRCAGIIDIGSRLSGADFEQINRDPAGTPIVLIDPWKSNGERVVVTDRASALCQTVLHLFAEGHRRFATFGIGTGTAYGRQRMKGISQACVKAGLSQRKGFHHFGTEPTKDHFEAGWNFGRRLLALPGKLPTALIALNDHMALGALRALIQAGRSVPDEFSIVGYDNSDFSAFITPPLTTIDSKPLDLVHAAMDLLLGSNLGLRTVTPALIIRQSTGPRKERKERSVVLLD